MSLTAIISPLIKQGAKAANALDAIMHNKYGSQPDKMAPWLSASHVERDPKREDSQPDPAPTPLPTPAPAK